MGDKDYTVSFSAEKAYYDRIAALEKTYAEFEGGHYSTMPQSEALSALVHKVSAYTD